MTTIDNRIDAYIESSGKFAQPILSHLRQLVHEANSDVKETIKWGFASFDYKGPLCSMASFKKHCVFGFWKAKLLNDPEGYLGERFNQGGEAMGNMGRITTLRDLPPDAVIIDFIRQASTLNDKGIKLPAPPKKEKSALIIPAYFMETLSKNKSALDAFENFSLSGKKEYVDWIEEAKTDETRNRRLETALEWMAQGKSRNWKYERK